jgi:hypothetical protein
MMRYCYLKARSTGKVWVGESGIIAILDCEKALQQLTPKEQEEIMQSCLHEKNSHRKLRRSYDNLAAAMTLPALLLFVLLTAPVLAANRYVFPAAGAQTCNGSGVTAITPATFNSTTFAPGDTTYIGGSFSLAAGASLLSFAQSGTSGNPITLRACTEGFTITSPYASGTHGAIYLGSGLSYIVVDGLGVGVGTIQNSGNGSGLSTEQQSYGVEGDNCTHCTVENLTIKNIYINAGSSSGATDINGANTACIAFFGAATGSVVTGNTVSQCKTGVLFSADTNQDASAIAVSYNNISDIDWGIAAGGSSNDTISGAQFFNNTITNWTNWQFPTGTLHQDGIVVFNFGASSPTVTVSMYNNYIYGDLGVGSPTAFLYCAQNATCDMYNNLLVNTGSPLPGVFWVGTGNSCSTIYNNTIIGKSNDSAITLGTGAITSGACQPKIQNNIIEGVKYGLHDYGTLLSDVSTSGVNNNVWASSPQMASGDGTAFYNYSTWTGTYGYDAASSTVDPALSGAYQIQTTGSSAYNLGANLNGLCSGLTAGLCSDKNSVARTSRWDAGAYQYVTPSGAPLPPTGLIAIVN